MIPVKGWFYNEVVKQGVLSFPLDSTYPSHEDWGVCHSTWNWKANGDKQINGILREQGSNMTRLHELW